jgi:hypothetical protein
MFFAFVAVPWEHCVPMAPGVLLQLPRKAKLEIPADRCEEEK